MRRRAPLFLLVTAWLLLVGLTACSAPDATAATADDAATDAQDPPAPDPADLPWDDLTNLALGKTDKGIEVHYYTEVYDLFLSPLRDRELRMLEIGIAQGGSLAVWQEYFPKAQIFALDIDPKSEFDNERVTTFVADQADREMLGAFLAEHGGDFDLIIDDGGHAMHHQQVSFGFLFDQLKPGGYYIIEDVHTSLRHVWGPTYGAEADGSNTTLTMIQDLMSTSEIHSQYMTPEEAAYASANIEYCNLFFRDNRFHSMMCIIKKRESPESAPEPEPEPKP